MEVPINIVSCRFVQFRNIAVPERRIKSNESQIYDFALPALEQCQIFWFQHFNFHDAGQYNILYKLKRLSSQTMRRHVLCPSASGMLVHNVHVFGVFVGVTLGISVRFNDRNALLFFRLVCVIQWMGCSVHSNSFGGNKARLALVRKNQFSRSQFTACLNIGQKRHSVY